MAFRKTVSCRDRNLQPLIEKRLARRGRANQWCSHSRCLGGRKGEGKVIYF